MMSSSPLLLTIPAMLAFFASREPALSLGCGSPAVTLLPRWAASFSASYAIAEVEPDATSSVSGAMRRPTSLRKTSDNDTCISLRRAPEHTAPSHVFTIQPSLHPCTKAVYANTGDLGVARIGRV